ncbi:MAG: hypothetical protein ACTSRK_12830 [Promethearchaeota archaeon]
MDALEKLNAARDVLLYNFFDKIIEVFLSEEQFTLKLIFLQGERLYIRYNDYCEYSYQFFYSSQLDDFICYDNFDDRWPVSSRPHHLHTKNKDVIESMMNGEPTHDMPQLSQKLLHFL